MTLYAQYCPISRTAEILGDRWTIHLIRDLLTGSSRFNELVRGNPGLSRALLSRRLRQLQIAGVVARTEDGSYQLTDAGRDLEPVVFGMATWGARWTFGAPADEELDPDLLMWWLHRQMDPTVVDDRNFTVHLQFSDHPTRYWIVVDRGVSVCLADPGFDVAVTLYTDRTCLYRIYLGHLALAQARRAGAIRFVGSRRAIATFLDSFRPSPVASIVAAER